MMNFLNSILFCLFTFTVIQAVNFLLFLTKNKKSLTKFPPGPKPLPIFGNLFELGDKPHQSFAKLASIYGPIMSLKLGQITTVVISSAAIAKEVLQTQDLAFSNRTIPDSIKAHNHDQLGMPWLSISSSQWRNLRKICNFNIFTAKKLDANFHLRRRKVQDMIDEVEASCEAGVEVDIGQVGFRTTLNLLSNTMFSVDVADPNSKFAKDFKEIVSTIMDLAGKPNLADYFPLLKVIDPQRIRHRMGYCFSKIFAFFDRITNERLKLFRVIGYVSSGDILDVLLKFIETSDEEIDRPHMDHLLLDLFAAGTDTTTSTLEFAMAELLHNRETLSKAQAELEKTIGIGRRICPGLPLGIRMIHLMLASLIHCFDWKFEDGFTLKDMNMDEKLGLTLHMAQPLRVFPVRR
ncbi:putative Cytochrome P450 [Quillaja saponaria]|uniref:Cytochrome P450 n=1 Tax=Quillaja saponaria TaxID=32244 RepID=A0AAD7LH78_QUISA|nr:putative Cytochrome P450 [Quillaja saponaria]